MTEKELRIRYAFTIIMLLIGGGCYAILLVPNFKKSTRGERVTSYIVFALFCLFVMVFFLWWT